MTSCNISRSSVRSATIFFSRRFSSSRAFNRRISSGSKPPFGEAPTAEPEPTIDVKTLHAAIGALTLENDFLSGALGKAGLLASAKR